MSRCRKHLNFLVPASAGLCSPQCPQSSAAVDAKVPRWAAARHNGLRIAAWGFMAHGHRNRWPAKAAG